MIPLVFLGKAVTYDDMHRFLGTRSQFFNNNNGIQLAHNNAIITLAYCILNRNYSIW